MSPDSQVPEPEGVAELVQESAARAHRNLLAGIWAAELLGLLGLAALNYAKHLVHADMADKEDERLLKKLTKDLKGKASPHEIREKLAHFFHVARKAGKQPPPEA